VATRLRVATLALALGLAAAPAQAAPLPGQRSFASPQAAVDALFDAVVSGDRRELRPLFGSDAARVAPIPDDAAMADVRDAFVATWSKGHAVQPQGDGRARLLLGENGWPYPLPVVREPDGRWRWDTRAGLQEMDARRIARNEYSAMSALHAYVDAQNEYARVDRDGDGVSAYATRIASRAGRRDGLYWPSAAGEPASPFGPDVGAAALDAQGGRPWRGYRFRILTGQGAAARGGAQDYRIDGRLLRGFAGIAVPASYGRSGVRTFVINHDNRIWSRDLGPHTRALAARIDRFDPGPGWQRED
jgi:hypothetical protein